MIDGFDLTGNYPNPFNASATIEYILADAVKVQIIVYDALGHRVSVLVNTIQPAGFHKINFDASGLPTGIYFLNMQAGRFIKTNKMMLAK